MFSLYFGYDFSLIFVLNFIFISLKNILLFVPGMLDVLKINDDDDDDDAEEIFLYLHRWFLYLVYQKPSSKMSYSVTRRSLIGSVNKLNIL